MAFATVYDLDGNAHEMEAVDARECVEEMGWSTSPPKVGGDSPTRDEMKAFLVEKGIEFPANIKADKLAELYAASQAPAE